MSDQSMTFSDKLSESFSFANDSGLVVWEVWPHKLGGAGPHCC